MRAYVGITDSDWLAQVRETAQSELNFWQPGGTRQFRALDAGELFLFKLHSPEHYIVGGGAFIHSTLLPISLAWQAYGLGNGVRSLNEMRARTQKYRRKEVDVRADYTVGCILLASPFFFDEDDWIPVPADWKPNIVQGKRYDTATEHGVKLLSDVRLRLEARTDVRDELPDRYGTGVLVRPRLGQSAFRVLITDAYERRCAATGEKVLPVLEAAHVRPYADGGEHALSNGLLLRSDFHTLFDHGYITVTPGLDIEVSTRLRSDFSNGRDYYAHHGRRLRQPIKGHESPCPENLQWHNENVFLG